MSDSVSIMCFEALQVRDLDQRVKSPSGNFKWTGCVCLQSVRYFDKMQSSCTYHSEMGFAHEFCTKYHFYILNPAKSHSLIHYTHLVTLLILFKLKFCVFLIYGILLKSLVLKLYF